MTKLSVPLSKPLGVTGKLNAKLTVSNSSNGKCLAPHTLICDACGSFILRNSTQIVKHLRVITIASFIVETYPEAETIYVVLDNWPVHYHADVLARLRPQPWVHAHMRPSHGSDVPSLYARIDNLPIEFLLLSTYASWLNPIEKRWRKLK